LNLKEKLQHGHDLIPITNDNEEPHKYLIHVQSTAELPAHDMGLDKIQFTSEAIQKGIESLVGTFIYDETRSNHNKRDIPEMRGRKVAKVVDTLYCPEHGGFVYAEPFDEEFKSTLNQAIDNRERGLPIKEGASTELIAHDGLRYDNNSLKVTDLSYNGLSWVDTPRDNLLGVCSVNNSIKELMEAEDMPETQKEENVFQLTKEEYDELQQLKTDYDELKAQYEGLKPEDFKEYGELLEEKEDLYKQLVPVWTAEGEKKMELVNSILETYPEAEREQATKTYEKMETEDLKVIVNSLAPKEPQRGIVNGGKPEKKEEEKYSWKTYQKRRKRGYAL